MFEIKVIDAFCGAGGMSLGLKEAGLEIALAFDIDENAIGTYRANFDHPCAKLDARKISGDDLRRISKLPRPPGSEVDVNLVLAGGPPCQGFSIQGRNPENDERNDLIFEFVRMVEELKPAMFVMENVTGIKGKKGKKHFDELLKRIKKAGYFPHVRTINAAEFGVPQIRKRVFVVGEYLFPGRDPCFSFPAPALDEKNFVTVSEALEGLPPPAKEAGSAEVPNHVLGKISKLNERRISHVPEGGGREHIPLELQLECHKNLPPDKIGHRYAYGRLHSEKPAGTITARFDSFTRGKFAHPFENRNITLREGARLQSFPDDFIFLGPKVEIAKQIGNAVPPLVAKAIGRSIKEAVEKIRENSNTQIS